VRGNRKAIVSESTGLSMIAVPCTVTQRHSEGERMRLRFSLSAATTFAVAAATAIVAWPVSPAAAEPPPCATTQLDDRAADAMAVRCGRDVEVLQARTAASQTFAVPAGGRRLVQYAEPRFTRAADGAWTDVDLRLRRVGNRVVPGATTVPMRFSAGGAEPLARISDSGRELTMSWPANLPAPVLADNTATYPEVRPGVDLRLTVTATSFAEVLVVKNRTAAAALADKPVTFGLSAPGLTTVPVAGGVEARDPAGRIVFHSPTPLMWDSGAETARVKKMPLHVGSGALAVTADRDLLTSPDAVYPIYVDPSWSGGISGNAWTSVWSRSDVAGSSFWQNGTALNNASTKGGAGAGRTEDCTGCGDYIIRSIFRMSTAAVLGKQILSATFRVQQRWAWTCSPATPAKLWLTGAISPSTTWNNQPAWDGNYTATAAANHRYGGGAGCATEGDVEFDAKPMVLRAVGLGSSEVNLGLRAADEGSNNHWKRFNAATPTLSIVYNTQPGMPDQLSVDNRPCNPQTGRLYVPTATPTLRARAADPDGDPLQVFFAYARWDAATASFVNVASGNQAGIPSGGTAQWVPPGLTDAGVYRFRAQSNDGRLESPVTAPVGDCEWSVDLVDPAAPEVTADLYQPGSVGCPSGGCGSIGQTGRFTFASSPDVVSYRWGFTDPPAMPVTPPAVGAPVTVTWTPSTGGPTTLYVQAIDRAGRTATRIVQFTVASAAPAVAHWRLADPPGSPTAADSSAGGHTATLTGATLGAPGRVLGGETAAHFEGGNPHAAATGPVIDTTGSFTVTAWARAGSVAATATIVSQDGATSAGLQLQYRSSCTCWEFALPLNDAADTARVYARSAPVTPTNVWTHLAGVRDAATGTITLYVDGKAIATAAGPLSHWSATARSRSGGPAGTEPSVSRGRATSPTCGPGTGSSPPTRSRPWPGRCAPASGAWTRSGPARRTTPLASVAT
jgi:hypothetical protein